MSSGGLPTRAFVTDKASLDYDFVAAPGVATPQTLAALAARHLGTDVSLITLDRRRDSFTNYVYRASSDDRSVVLKQSDNISFWSRCLLPAAHIKVEYQFLKACRQLPTGKVKLPCALDYDESSNTLVMSDLGRDGLPLHRVSADRAPDAAVIEDLGAFLKRIHDWRGWPAEFIALLEAGSDQFGWCAFKIAGWSEHEPRWSCESVIRKPVRPGITVMDFTPQNCLLYGQCVGIFDFDFVFLADQLYDLANFQSRMLFLAASGQIPPRDVRLINALLTGYCAGDIGRLERELPAWNAFCRYLAALIHYRFARDYGEAMATDHVPLTRRIFEGSFPPGSACIRRSSENLRVANAAYT